MSARSRQGGGGSESVQDQLAEARSFMEAGKYGKAASTLKKILAKDAEHWEALRLSATLNLKLGSLFAARSAFESLARKAIDRGDALVAQSLLKEYLAVVPRYIPFLEMLGQVCESTGNTSGALVEYGKALSFIEDEKNSEHKSRGVGIYRRVKALDPTGPIARRLAEVYEAEAAALEAAERQAAASQPSSPSSSGPAVQPDPWMGQDEPAPFPWEVPGGQAPAASEPAAEAAPPVPPPAPPPRTDDVSSGGFRFTTTPAPAAEPEKEIEKEPLSFAPEPEVAEPPAIETPAARAETAAEHATEPLAEPAGSESPSGSFSTETATPGSWGERSAEQTTASEESWLRGGEAASTPVEEPTPTAASVEPEAAPEAPPSHAHDAEEEGSKPTSGGFFGFRLASAWRRDREPSGADQTATPEESPAATPPEAEAPPSGWFQADSSALALEADREAPQLYQHDDEQEEDSHAPAAPPAKRRGRRRGADRSASTAPTWAAPPAPGESHTAAPPKLFPTATKLKFKVTIFSRRVLSAVRSFTVLTVGLATGCVLLAVLAVVGLSLVWIGTEEKPSNAFYNLMKVPPPPLLDRRQNGYLKLISIGASVDRRPVRMGERRTVVSADPAGWPEGFAELSTALSGWYGTWDPVEQFEKQRGVIRQWSAFFGSEMARYNKWVASPIEDVGYASLEAPDEGMVLGIHRLYVAEGFSEGMARGVSHLQRDLETWRHALAEAKTLRFKMLAMEALNDDLIVMSGLLARPELNLGLLPTMAKMSRPMDHAERSLRWPMQNQFVLEMEMARSYLRTRGDADQRPDYIKALTFFPLPKQKIFNAHAEYYEALVKHDSALKIEGDPRKEMPQRYDLTSAPPKTFSDYIANPVDNLLVQDDRVDWHEIIGRVLETEARLRLGSLQVRIRRRPATTKPLTRIANAGQDYYDPFTGFTMLLNGTKTILYSVGRDGQDDDGDLTTDVSVPLTRQDF